MFALSRRYYVQLSENRVRVWTGASLRGAEVLARLGRS